MILQYIKDTPITLTLLFSIVSMYCILLLVMILTGATKFECLDVLILIVWIFDFIMVRRDYIYYTKLTKDFEND